MGMRGKMSFDMRGRAKQLVEQVLNIQNYSWFGFLQDVENSLKKDGVAKLNFEEVDYDDVYDGNYAVNTKGYIYDIEMKTSPCEFASIKRMLESINGEKYDNFTANFGNNTFTVSFENTEENPDGSRYRAKVTIEGNKPIIAIRVALEDEKPQF